MNYRYSDIFVSFAIIRFIRYARKPQVSNLGMNGILSERSQVEPGEAEQIGT